MTRSDVAARLEVAAAACLRRRVLIVEDGQPDLVLVSWTEWGRLSATSGRRSGRGGAGRNGAGCRGAAAGPHAASTTVAAARRRHPTAWEQLSAFLGGDLGRVEAIAVTVGVDAAVMPLAEARPYLEGFGFHTDPDEPWEARPTWGEARPFVAWTPERTVFPLVYDGVVVFRSVPRNPAPVSGLMRSWP